MTTNGALMVRDEAGAKLLEQVVVGGDLSQLSPSQRLEYYRRVCESLGLNPLTKPFDYIVLNGKLTLYARKDCTEQLRSLRGVSISIVARELHESIGVYAVTARATTKDGRVDEAIGAVSIAGLKGEQLANAFMKAETKAKRRVTLSICGLGMLDETEIGSIPDARRVEVDEATGEIVDAPVAPVYPSQHEAAIQAQAPANGNGKASSDKPATDKQIRMIFALRKKLSEIGWTEDEVVQIWRAKFGERRPKDLTSAEASAAIELLQQMEQGQVPPIDEPADTSTLGQEVPFNDEEVPF